MKINKLTFTIFLLMLVSCKSSTFEQEKPVLPGSAAYEAEVEDIMEVIKGEFKAYFIKDYKSWSESFVQEDYLKYWGYWEGYPEKVKQYNTWKEVDEDKKKRMDGEILAYWDENDVSMDIRDLNAQIRGDVAWVTFRQRSTDKQTGEFLGDALETKILEKINGEWKIAYLNFLYLPLDTIAD